VSSFVILRSHRALLIYIADDVKTTIGGLVSGGFETMFSSAIADIGLLASPESQTIQKGAYDDTMSVYSSLEQAYVR
jgi:phenylacetate 2-hydroxylase